MPFPALRLVVFLAGGLAALPAAAHELWLEARDWQPAADGMLEVDLVNGQLFAGTRLPYLPRNTARLDLARGGAAEAAAPRIGDTPALEAAADDGLVVAIYQSQPADLTYSGPDVFERFVVHKDLAGGYAAVMEIAAAQGYPAETVTEAYTRYSKALVGAGDAAGADARFGLETEFVALENPYTDDVSDGLDVQLFHDDEVRADAQIEVFEKASVEAGEVRVTTLRTDAKGRATIPVTPGHVYQLDAVILRLPEIETDQQWESLWANLTFAVPG